MQSAFVDIGLEKAAFLYVGDIQTGDEYARSLKMRRTAIQWIFSRRGPFRDVYRRSPAGGQELLVQVSKDP